GSGEYSVARNADEKVVIGTVAGLRTLNADNQSYMRQQDTFLERMITIKNLFTPPHISFTDLQTLVTNGSGTVLNEDPIDFDLRVDFFRLSDNRVLTAFTIQPVNKELSFKDTGRLQ